MKTILITGGTTFVSRFAAAYFCRRGYQVTVLNRNTRPQVPGVQLITADRHDLGDRLKHTCFDAVLDITAYNGRDVADLMDGLGSFGQYILISSSAVYPENSVQPFAEEFPLGANRFWGAYGTDKIAAETAALERVPDAYILRPPYLYGPGNNVYREAFVFDCALADRPFYLPGQGEMQLQFYHVQDLCAMMETILLTSPAQHILNVGNPEAISVMDWVTLCYRCCGREPRFIPVSPEIEQRSYFPFYRYEYFLDVQKQQTICPCQISLQDGLTESLQWYLQHPEGVRKKPFFDFIDRNLAAP